MKRLHVSLSVSKLEQSRGFYAAMFGSEPTMERDHYVQWELDDPAVNFVIEDANAARGLTHLGIQASDQGELEEQFARVTNTGGKVLDEGETQCCYAKSTKNWVLDPDGVPWETFLTHERTEDFGAPSIAGVTEVEPEPEPDAKTEEVKRRPRAGSCACC